MSGFLLAILVCHLANSRQEKASDCDNSYQQVFALNKQLIARVRSAGVKSRLFIGVMTAQKYFDQRVIHILNTWGKDADHFLVFFTSFSSNPNLELPIVYLPTVDDSYPPQKKSFLMLKFIHDHFIDQFDWFMRADDDVFVDVEKLEIFLRQLDPSRPYLIGQMGLGKMNEFGHLGLNDDDNFCMGGPGILMSRATLRELVPNIQYCLKHLYSTHEDVEVGRCVHKFVGVKCTSSYEMQSLFYHNFSGDITWSANLRRTMRYAITLHPVKNSQIMYNIYDYVLEKRYQKLYDQILDFQEQENQIKEIMRKRAGLGRPVESTSQGTRSSFNKTNHCQNRETIINYDFFDRYLFSPMSSNPKKAISMQLAETIENNLAEVISSLNKDLYPQGKSVNYRAFNYGYHAFDFINSSTYILDVQLTYRQYRKQALTLSARKRLVIDQFLTSPKIRAIDTDKGSKTVVNMIVPLSGRISAFKRFIATFKEIHAKDANIKLLFVVFRDRDQSKLDGCEYKQIISNLSSDGLPVSFVKLSGQFSRAAGLQYGSNIFKPNDLLFFIDIDLQFDEKVFQRIRRNTIQGKQVYFPIIFSQFGDLSLIGSPREKLVPQLEVNSDSGYWRQFGFGIAALYNSDVQAINGFNTNIKGWGKEDVDFYNRFVANSSYSIMRAPDLGLIHIYHENDCDGSLNPVQYHMCLGTKFSNLASSKKMAEYLIKNKVILD